MLTDYKYRFRALWDPTMYHGWGKTRNYFEGWYVKLVDPTEQYVFALIPGISMDKDGEQHAFVQVLDGKQATATYHRFNAGEFQPATTHFAVHVGESFFSADRLELRFPELIGDLQLSDQIGWPATLGAPGVMGWYSFVPFMQCYHGVVSMDHRLEGRLEVHGQTVDFTGGRGYLEKDWGRSFPAAWIWWQTNHFDTPTPTSLMVSVGHIPWLGSHFVGFLAGWYFEGQLYRFTTYTGAKMKVYLEGDTVHMVLRQKNIRLEMAALHAPGGELVSPLGGQMAGKVNESMQATVRVRFYVDDRLCYEGTGRNAGMEVAGNYEVLLR